MTRAATLIAVVLVLTVPLLLSSGCAHPKRWFSNRSMVRDTVVTLPGDGAVFVEIEQTERLGRRERLTPRYVWQQPPRATKVLAVSGDPPAVLDRATMVSRVSDDGNTVTLAEAGRIVATFDYAAGTATFSH